MISGKLQKKPWIFQIPSRYLTVCHGKSPFLIGKPSINGPFPMAILNNQMVHIQGLLPTYHQLCTMMSRCDFVEIYPRPIQYLPPNFIPHDSNMIPCHSKLFPKLFPNIISFPYWCQYCSWDSTFSMEFIGIPTLLRYDFQSPWYTSILVIQPWHEYDRYTRLGHFIDHRPYLYNQYGMLFYKTVSLIYRLYIYI